MKKRWTVLLLVLLAAVLVASPVLAKSSWNANSVWPPKNHQSVGLNNFAEKVKKATNGELEIVVHTGGALGYKGPELLKTVRDGLVPDFRYADQRRGRRRKGFSDCDPAFPGS